MHAAAAVGSRASESQSVLRQRPPLHAPPPVLVVILHLHLRRTHRRCRAGDPCAGAGRGGRGRLVVSESPAPEASLDLAGQVSLEHNVAGLVEHLKGCCFLLEVE